MITTLAWAIGSAAVVGGLVSVLASALTLRFLLRPGAPCDAFPPVTLIKPLHGHPRRLEEALESFCRQDYPGAIEIVFGVEGAADPAVLVVRALQARHPEKNLKLIVDGRLHGANRKVSNLINIAAAAASHPILVLSDADIEVERDYLRKVVGALAQPGVGAVSCPYVGASAPGLWSRLNAMAINYAFLPNAILGKSLGMAEPCFGATIALRRETLDRIGGFETVVAHRADDYEIGRAVRGLGLKVALPPIVVAHHCHEPTARALVDHELRWGRTVRQIDPAGYAGSLVTHGFPLAILAATMLEFSPPAIGLIFTTILMRMLAKGLVDRATGAPAGRWWLLPVRDVLSFAVFLASFAGRTVKWQGRHSRVSRAGVLTHL